MKIKVLVTLFLFWICSSVAYSQLYINEWMASNSSSISDPDFDNTGDWIELFNDFNDPIDISGYFLTDNLNNPTKWSFPEGTSIEANSHLIIWADGINEGIHTSFKLTKDGEEIGLYGTDTVQLDQILFKHQKTNISMGRSNDGSSTIGFFIEPTPGSSNSTNAYTAITFYQPRFSVLGGIKRAPITLNLEATEGQIRYTTDGSFPTPNSDLYTDPIQISETTIIKAAVFIENQIPGKPITHTYFYEPSFEERELPVISITSDAKYFWDDSIGIYVQDFKPSWEYPINIELFENDGSDRAAFNELAGTKVNGLNSWVLPQKMLGIYFDNDYDKNNLDYQLFFDEKRTRFDNFILRASGSDWGSTLFRDVLCQNLTNDYMDIEKMAFRPSIMYLNGEYMGIHNMRSRIDEGFIEENFNLTSTEYDLIENNGEVEEGDDIAFRDLFTLFDNDLSISDNFLQVSAVLDLDNLTDYYITEIWTSNSSWGHNIQMWKPKTPNSKWRFIFTDLDRGFTGVDDELIHKFTASQSPSNYNWARIPLNSLFQNEDFSHQFAQRFLDHMYTTFHPNRVLSLIEEHKHLIDQEIQYHSNRWVGTTSSYGNGIPSVSYWEDEVTELEDFANQRPSIMIEDVKTRFELGDIRDLSTIVNPSNGGQILINELPIPNSPWLGQYVENLEFQLRASPNVGQEFLGWSTGQFETLIQRGDEWKYLDDGSDQGTSWTEVDFDDSSWSAGSAKFGYGDDNETTTISFGNNEDNKHITTYFRKEIIVDDISAYTGTISIELLRDDGASVYLNGKEIIRSNLPQGEINFTTQSSSSVAEQEENTYFNFTIDHSDLVQGSNVLAVEIHQRGPNSSDLGFDLRLKALKISAENFISTDPVINISLDSDSILVANYQQSNPCTLPRSITTNTTLDISCSPYYAISSIEIDSMVTLSVDPGVQILFPPNANLTVRGNLEVNGTEDVPVLFTAIEEDAPWGGIIFHYASDVSSLQYFEISKASNGIHPIYENAAISAFHSKVEIDHLTIEDVESNPILAYYSDVTLKNSVLHSKVTGDLINIKYGYGHVENCTFRGNNEIDTDAIDYDDVTDGKIINNKIFDFLGFNSDGIDIGEESGDVLVEGNFIHNCSDKGISVGQGSFLTAVNNIITNCDKGIAIKDLSGALIDQNTFYNVGNPVSCFEKNVGLGGGFSYVSNSILSNSYDAPIQLDSVSQIEVVLSLSDTDSLPETLNLFANPLFENPTHFDFSLMHNSAAIGAGFDDVNGMSINLGAESYPQDNEPSLMISGIQYFPQGNQDAEFILIYNPRETSLDIQGYMLTDAIEFTFPQGVVIEPQETILVALNTTLVDQDVVKKFTWLSGRLSNEGETIILRTPAGIVADHVTYDNKAPWPLDAEGNGSFLKLKHPSLDNHFASSWESNLPTSIKNPIIVDRNIKTYPNPTSDVLTIEYAEGQINTIEILNTIGQTVFSKTVASSSIDIDVQDLKTGIYLIKVNGVTENNPIVIHK